jgi:hypothetical protein
MSTLINGKFTEEELNNFVETHSLDDEQLAKKLGIEEAEIDNQLKLVKKAGYRFWAKNTLTENHSGWVNKKNLKGREKKIFKYIRRLA